MPRMTSQGTTVRASAMHPSLGGRVASGYLNVNGDRLRFEGSDVSVEFTLSGLQLRAGGYNDEQLFFEHPAQAGWTITSSDHSILQDLTVMADPVLQDQIRAVSRRKSSVASRFLVVTSVFLAVVVALIVLLVSQKSRLARMASNHVPISVEE